MVTKGRCQGPERWDVLVNHVERCYPDEGCGVLIEGKDGIRAVTLTNVYDRYHARDPERFPRTARTAYLIDPKEMMVLQEALDEAGETLLTIFHSHADVGAYFSDEDRQAAAPDGEPLFPGLTYLVLAVDKGRTTGARWFRWQENGFAEAAGDGPPNTGA